MEWQILGGEAIKRTEVEVEWGSLRMVKMRSQERWVVDWFWSPGENNNGRRVVEFCAERRICVSNTEFDYRSLHKYTRVARGQDGVVVKSMIDLVMVKKDMLR